MILSSASSPTFTVAHLDCAAPTSSLRRLTSSHNIVSYIAFAPRQLHARDFPKTCYNLQVSKRPTIQYLRPSNAEADLPRRFYAFCGWMNVDPQTEGWTQQ
jgi:hypothetical protein